MPTSPNHLKPTSSMAVAVDHCFTAGGLKSPTWNRRCRLRSFPHPDPNLLDLSSLSTSPSSPSFHRSFSTPCLSSFPPSTTADESAAANSNIARVEIIAGRRARGVHALVVEVAIAMVSGARLVPASSGLGGAYILCNRDGSNCAVVKHADHEDSTVGVFGLPAPWRFAGETRVREAAAYLLDHGGFSGVPPTALLRISHPSLDNTGNQLPDRYHRGKVASIQRFVPHHFDAGDLGPSRFSISSVHRIGILDIRLLNVDRHAGNILVRQNHQYDHASGDAAAELVPIDHGLCLPEQLEDPYFEWLHWPQAAVPFSDTEAEFIASLEPLKDAELLRSELPSLRESSIRIMILCTKFLKCAVAAGLCLAEIGKMMTREFGALEDEPSALDALCKQVENSMNVVNSLSAEDNIIDEYDDEVFYIQDEQQPEEAFQFGMDCNDGEQLSAAMVQNVLDIPLLLRGKQDIADEHQHEVLLPFQEEEEEEGQEGSNNSDDDRSEPNIGGMIIKSVSFSAAELNLEAEDRQSCITFKGLNEEEWIMFLERFEQLLPEAMEERKKSVVLKQRLGTSF